MNTAQTLSIDAQKVLDFMYGGEDPKYILHEYALNAEKTAFDLQSEILECNLVCYPFESICEALNSLL